jgi:hypothetical protein
VIPGKPTAVETLGKLMASSTAVFSDVLSATVTRLAADAPVPVPAGTMFRFERG